MLHHQQTAKVFSLTGNDVPVENIITKLKFLSKIKSGEKINVRQLFVRNNDSIHQRFARTVRNLAFEGESKEETLEFIKFIINDAINLICVYRSDTADPFKQRIADMIVENLRQSKQGIKALTGTYSDNILFVSQIEAVVDTLDARIDSLMSSMDISATTSAANTTNQSSNSVSSNDRRSFRHPAANLSDDDE